MPAHCRAAGAFQHELSAHELSIVFANRAFRRLETGIWQIGASGELPAISEQIFVPYRVYDRRFIKLIATTRLFTLRDDFPFELHTAGS